MPHLWRDVRHTLRSLARVPALAATIVLTVGVALGATVAAIVVTRAVVVDPLPYADADAAALDLHRQRALPVPALGRRLPRARGRSSGVQRGRGLSALQVTVADGDVAERVPARAVTGSYFPLLGQHAAASAACSIPSDDTRDDRIVVLSHGYWQRRFGGDPSASGPDA